MKKILVPTDFSMQAAKAYPVAASLARKFNAEIHFVFNLKSDTDFHLPSFKYSFLGLKKLETRTLTITQQLNKLYSNKLFTGIKTTFGTDTISNKERNHNKLTSYINRFNFSLMVVGVHEEKPESISIAEKIANHAGIPILSIHNLHKPFSPKKIMLCTNFKDINNDFIYTLENFALIFGAKIEIVFINSKNHHYDNSTIIQQHRLFNTRFKLSKPELQIYNGKHIVESICHAATHQNFDLIAITTHAYQGLSHFFHHNKAERITKNANIPVYSWNISDTKIVENTMNTMSINRGMMY